MSLLDGFTFDDIEYLVDTNPYLRGYLQGYLAELALLRQIETMPGVTSVKKIPDSDSRKGDLEVIFRGVVFTIECKSVESSSVREDLVHNTWTGYVGVKNSDKREIEIEGELVRLCNLNKGAFDILAISCFAVNGQWNFLFIENKYLPEPNGLPGFIKSKFIIDPISTACVTSDLPSLLTKLVDQASSVTC